MFFLLAIKQKTKSVSSLKTCEEEGKYFLTCTKLVLANIGMKKKNARTKLQLKQTKSSNVIEVVS